MILHIGNDISIHEHWLVAILDIDRSSAHSPLFREFLSRAEREGKLEWLGPEIPRTVVVTADRVYLTAVRAETLRQRCAEGSSLTEAERLGFCQKKG